jgi:hypothetical protein
MRLIVGMIFGAFLTVAGAFTYDTLSGRVPDTTEIQANDQRPMVNWDVVNKNWHSFEANVRDMAARVHEQLKKLTG